MKKEMVSACPTYVSDLDKVKEVKNKKGYSNLRDAFRFILEQAEAHGALS